MFAISLLLIFLILGYILYRISARKFNYWKNLNVPHLPPIPFFGNYASNILMMKFNGKLLQEICQKFPDQPYIGAYYGTEPTLIVQDPSLIALVTTKDFYYFNSREIADHVHKEVMTQNIFFNYGDQWKAVRQNLSPMFSTGKMRNMFPLVEKCAISFEEYLDREISISEVNEVSHLMTRYTMACITSCAFGAEVDMFDPKSDDNPFLEVGKMIFLNTYFRGYKLAVRSIWPSLFYGLKLTVFPDRMINFFKYFATGIFEARKYKPTSRNDFIDLILNMREQKSIVADRMSNAKNGKEDKIVLPITNDLLVAQCALFFAAGFETSSGTLTCILYELAKNPEAQKKAIEEVDRYLENHKNRVNYECMSELVYTRACLDEAVRIHPALGVLTRELVEDYTLPDGLRLDKGVRVHIPVYHLHHNPEFFPEPHQFRPERFLAANRGDIKPNTYMPFGDGGRVCIGKRFGKMQVLAGLVTVLKKYRVETTERTPKALDYDPRALVAMPTEKIYLRFVRRDGWEERMYPRQPKA